MANHNTATIENKDDRPRPEATHDTRDISAFITDLGKKSDTVKARATICLGGDMWIRNIKLVKDGEDYKCLMDGERRNGSWKDYFNPGNEDFRDLITEKVKEAYMLELAQTLEQNSETLAELGGEDLIPFGEAGMQEPGMMGPM